MYFTFVKEINNDKYIFKPCRLNEVQLTKLKGLEDSAKFFIQRCKELGAERNN